jgi:CBS domain-containing protein
VVGGLREILMRHPPFAQMPAAHVDWLLARASEAYFAPGETILEPADGPVTHLHIIRDGAVTATRGAGELQEQFEHESGDLFPVGALLAARPVSGPYRARRDTFCLLLPRADVDELAAVSPPFADLLNRRLLHLIDASRRALHGAYASGALAEQSQVRRLAELITRPVQTCGPDTPLEQALRTLQAQRIGAMLVVDADGAPTGILTRHDLLDRVTLPQRPLSTPIGAVMTSPVHSLGVDDSAHDAARLMARHGLRHVPVTRDGRAVGMVSERDLFAMQRLSIGQLSDSLRAARDLGDVQAAAGQLRRFARLLLAQGVHARQLTELISHLNDRLTTRLIELIAPRHGRDLQRACWLAFGSEGRSEQTLATDQDNGLVFESDEPEADRPAWLAFAREVNEALDACGYPLCRGGVMAGNPDCCLTPAEWQQRFARWMEQGAPQDLLAASIYFDLRPLAGRLALAEPLRAFVTQRARELPRFCRQLAEEVLRTRPPLNWLGQIEAQSVDGVEGVDLKGHGTAIFVNAARLQALARGLPEVGTRPRFEAIARARGTPTPQAESWIGAFEFLQMLRLRAQLEAPEPGRPGLAPNRVRLDRLSQLDRRILKESLRVARRLQQEIELEYLR